MGIWDVMKSAFKEGYEGATQSEVIKKSEVSKLPEKPVENPLVPRSRTVVGAIKGIPNHFDRVVWVGNPDHTLARESLGQTIANNVQKYTEEEGKVGDKIIQEKNEFDDVHFGILAKHVQNFVQRYDANPQSYEPEIFRKTLREESQRNGAYEMFSGRIVIEEGTVVEEIATMIHEILHRASFHSLTLDPYSVKTDLRRNGISIFPGRKEDRDEKKEKISGKRQKTGRYFEALDEAITAECHKRIWREILKKDPLIQKKFKASEQVKELMRAKMQAVGMPKEYQETIISDVIYIENAENLLLEIKEHGLGVLDRLIHLKNGQQDISGESRLIWLERSPERNQLAEIVDTLFEKSNGTFKNREEIFDMFAKAHFSGNIFPLARMVDGILGKGAFRKMAEETGSEETKAGDLPRDVI